VALVAQCEIPSIIAPQRTVAVEYMTRAGSYCPVLA
jgi:hypothetical protein